VKTGWNEFMHWAATFLAQPNFEALEITPKLQAVEPLVGLSLEGDDWYDALRRGFQGPDSHLVPWQVSGPFLEWAERSRRSAAEALGALWTDDDLHAAERIDAFDAIVPAEIVSRPGVLCNLAGYLLGAKDPTRWPNFQLKALKHAYELTRFAPVPPKSSPGRHYGHALAFFDRVIAEAHSRDLPVENRLQAQGLTWVIANRKRDPDAYDLTAGQWAEFEAFVELPSALKKEQTAARAKARAITLQKKRPTQGFCPLCGNDDKLRLTGSAEDGWEYLCEGTDGHAEPYRFAAR
jgi:hypothetical protein